MKIQKIVLRNFRGHKNLIIDFEDNLTVIAGENGAGKSSVLDAISLGISWIVAKIKNPSGRGGSQIKISDITIGEKNSLVGLKFDEIGNVTLNGVNTGGKIKLTSILHKQTTDYQGRVHQNISDNIAQNLPIFAHYGVRRAVIDIPLRIRNKSHDSIFETYDKWSEGGANFKSFFEWFRNQEDIENEKLRYWNNGSNSLLDNVNNQTEKEQFRPDRELSTVRRALEAFMPDYKNIRVSRKPLRMLIDKGNDTLNVEQMSDGEKIYFALVGDLCRRLVLANPIMEDPLQGEGIVLIDEIDLHLHPNWQKDIAVRLTEVFPNVQFVITTHSPLVLTNIPTISVRFLKDNEAISTNSLYGLPTSIILKDKMGLSNELPLEIENLIKEIANYIDVKDIENAKSAYNKLQQLSPDNPELVRFNFFINRLMKK